MSAAPDTRKVCAAESQPPHPSFDVEPLAFRKRLLATVLRCLRDSAGSATLSVFEGGSAATGRLDRFSDVDLYVIAEPARFDELFTTIEAGLGTFATITHVWPVSPAPWPGFAQKIYLLAPAPPFFMFDCCLLRADTAEEFLQVERHGRAQVLHDPQGRVRAPAFDRSAWNQRIATRQSQIVAALPVYRLLVEKEIARRRMLDAFAFYQVVLRLFIELAGIVYRPERFDYGWRYLHTDLPDELQTALLRWLRPADGEAMSRMLDEVSARIQLLLVRMPPPENDCANERDS